jgi:hypothetical protein
MSGSIENPPAHDYLDDLESFYYVLCWICFGHDAPGKRITPQPDVITDWEDPSSSCIRAARLKEGFLFSKRLFPKVPPYFGPVIQTLLEEPSSLFCGSNCG